MSITVGDRAPEFALKDQDGNEVTLAGLAGRKTLIVFIPFPFTSICEGELCAIRDERTRFNDLDANVVAVSCDTRPANRKWSQEQGFGFPILSDFWPHGEVCRAYGVFNEKVGAANRATVVLDEAGVVADIISTENLSIARELEACFEALASIG